MKYLCFQCEGEVLEVLEVLEVFTFPRTVNHDDMAKAIMCLTDQSGYRVRVLRVPVTAGFVSPGRGCYGRSITLKLDSDGERDSRILSQQLAK